MRWYQLLLPGLILTIFSIGSATTVEAGGFSSQRSYGGPGAVMAKALAKATGSFYGKNVNIKTTNTSETGTEFISGGKIMRGYGNSKTKNEVSVYGNTKYDSTTKSASRIFVKGKNLSAKSGSKTKLKVYVNGKLVLIQDAATQARTRHTPLGTMAAANAYSNPELVAQGQLNLSGSTSANASANVGQ